MKDTESQATRRAQRQRAKRFRKQVTAWLNSGRAGSPPQPTTWFPELPAILNQAGLLVRPPHNFYIPQPPPVTDEDNRYEAQLARNRARYAQDALAAGQPYRPSNRLSEEVRPSASGTADGEGVSIVESPEPTDKWVEYEMQRVRIHSLNIMRKRAGKPLLPMPPARLKPGSPAWWSELRSRGVIREVPSLEAVQRAAYEQALRGELPETLWTPVFREGLADYLAQRQAAQEG